MEQLIDISRPLMQGYLFLFGLMLLMAWLVFWPYRTAKKMKEKREEESIEDVVRMKADCLKPPEPSEHELEFYERAIKEWNWSYEHCIFFNPKYNNSLRKPKWRQGEVIELVECIACDAGGHGGSGFAQPMRDDKPSDYNTLGRPKARPSL